MLHTKNTERDRLLAVHDIVMYHQIIIDNIWGARAGRTRQAGLDYTKNDDYYVLCRRSVCIPYQYLIVTLNSQLLALPAPAPPVVWCAINYPSFFLLRNTGPSRSSFLLFFFPGEKIYSLNNHDWFFTSSSETKEWDHHWLLIIAMIEIYMIIHVLLFL